MLARNEKAFGFGGIVVALALASSVASADSKVTLSGADAEWSVPEGSKLNDEQYAAYKAGNLYVNVHSAANKGGEIRAQLKP